MDYVTFRDTTYMRVDVGQTIEGAVGNAIDIAIKIDTDVFFEFNDIAMVATPHSEFNDLIKFHEMMKIIKSKGFKL